MRWTTYQIGSDIPLLILLLNYSLRALLLMDIQLSFLFSPKLSHFLCVYAHRNLRIASELLLISQPALTKSLKSLEKELGVILFTRSKKGMEPTEAGNILFEHIEKMSHISRNAEVALSRHSSKSEGLIRIGAGQMWSWLFIPDIVSKFKQMYPTMKLEITTGPMPDLVDQLTSKQVDVVVGDFHGISVSDAYKVEQVWSSEFWAFAASDHDLVLGDDVHLEDLVEYSWSGYIDHDLFEQKISSICAQQKLTPPNINIKATSLATLFRLTKDSSNILVLPHELRSEAERAGLLPIRSEKLQLWTINTGSIIDNAKTSLEQYKDLLKLIQGVGSRSVELMASES